RLWRVACSTVPLTESLLNFHGIFRDVHTARRPTSNRPNAHPQSSENPLYGNAMSNSQTSGENVEWQERQGETEGNQHRREGCDRDYSWSTGDVRKDSSLHTTHATRITRHSSQDTILSWQVYSQRDNPAIGRSV